MGGLKTFTAAILLVCAPASSALADQMTGPALVRLFADCAGRYSAMTEHLWLWDGPASEIAATKRDLFTDLLAATAPEAAGPSAPEIMGWRIEAKAAQRALLDQAAFRAGGKGAADTAERLLSGCDRLILGS